MISFLTATRDRPDFLAEAIASVEAQTRADWEHLVYDDGSTDPRVAEVLKAAKKRNPERFYYTCPGFEGPHRPAAYWNILAALSRGEYLTILDDDNTKHPEFIERMLSPMEVEIDGPVDAVSCGWVCVDEHGRPLHEVHANTSTTPEALFLDNTIDSNALVFRRRVLDKIGQFSTALTTSEDWHFMIRLVRHCTVVHLPDALLNYREHTGSRSNQYGAMKRLASLDRVRRELFPTGRP